MKFDYLKQPNFLNPNKPWISRPIIPIELSRGEKNVKVFALVDSGADLSLFHVSLAKELNIDIEKGRKEIFRGISEDQGIEVYLHAVSVRVGGDSVFDIEAGFTESKNVGAILGQVGFFDYYHIKFERDKERIEIAPARKE